MKSATVLALLVIYGLQVEATNPSQHGSDTDFTPVVIFGVIGFLLVAAFAACNYYYMRMRQQQEYDRFASGQMAQPLVNQPYAPYQDQVNSTNSYHSSNSSYNPAPPYKEAPPEAPQLPSSSHNLPPGWEEAVNPTDGKIYYYNRAQNETTWKRPAY